MRNLRSAIPGIIGLLCIAGCTTLSPSPETLANSSATLEPSAIIKFNDIPIPAGFKLLAQQSYSFESGGFRVGILRYQGKANPDQVVAFYKTQMSMYSWNLLNVIEYGDRLMNFERDNESCIVNLLAKGSASVITISLGPKTGSRTGGGTAHEKKPREAIK